MSIIEKFSLVLRLRLVLAQITALHTPALVERGFWGEAIFGTLLDPGWILAVWLARHPDAIQATALRVAEEGAISGISARDWFTVSGRARIKRAILAGRGGGAERQAALDEIVRAMEALTIERAVVLATPTSQEETEKERAQARGNDASTCGCAGEEDCGTECDNFW